MRKSEKGTPVIFWTWIDKEPDDKAREPLKRRIPLLRYYTVFNLEQCEGVAVPPATIPAVFDPI